MKSVDVVCIGQCICSVRPADGKSNGVDTRLGIDAGWMGQGTGYAITKVPQAGGIITGGQVIKGDSQGNVAEAW